VTPLQSRQDLWRQKTSDPGISHGVVCMIPRLTILVQYQRVTDGQTHDDSIYRAIINTVYACDFEYCVHGSFEKEKKICTGDGLCQSKIVIHILPSHL